MRSGNFLERFRLAGAPGAAAGAGVPADRRAERSAELEPVFREFSGMVGEVRRIRDEATADAERIRSEAVEQARAVVDAARNNVGVERADAAARAGGRAGQETAATLASAERDAALVRSRAEDRMPDYVSRALVRARNVVAEDEP
jgi:hypothetical protein